MKIENIKFKAKTFDNAEWVEGYYIKKPSYHQTPKGDVVEDGEDHLIFGMTKDDVQPLCYEVDPSTVCQFTGLKDCKGNEVWEGDMLSNVTNDSPDGIVVFKYGAFCLLAKNGRDFCVALTYLLSEKESLNRFKVIGNKFHKEK